MTFSKHNIISKVRNSDNYYIVNLLSGEADLLTANEAATLTNGGDIAIDHQLTESLQAKGYLTDRGSEDKNFRLKYWDFTDQRDDEDVQLFFVMNYSCNVGCCCCYQDEYTNPNSSANEQLIDAFFVYLDKELTHRRKYITLFGGEPLLHTPHQRQLVDYFIGKSAEAEVEVCVVTNGYHLENYIPILKKGLIREIQVTLDGTESVHNMRRMLKGGGATFEAVVRGIDSCLQNNMPVNLRMVVDKENISNLPALATYAIERGWTSHPLFKTQIGRNYELHHCQSTPDKLFTRISLYESIYQLTEQYPHISQFYKPAYSVAKYLNEHGRLPDPLFDACPACKSEWAFDYTGTIYSCTATVGKSEEALGTFWPVISKNQPLIQQWESRDVTTIPECKDCSVQLACGGGCGSVAKNKNGKILSPDCRPVKALLELGFAAYFKEVEQD